jgi:hypothetical protein
MMIQQAKTDIIGHGTVEKKIHVPLTSIQQQILTESQQKQLGNNFYSITPIAKKSPSKDSYSMSEHKPPADKKSGTLTLFPKNNGGARNSIQRTEQDMRLVE